MEHEKIIHILEYLERNTDDSHYASISDIKEHLENNYGYQSVSVLTIRRDIERLEAMGKNISCKNGAHNKRLYSLASDSFTFNEIRFLVDSVSINKFLSDAQKRRLFHKFEKMCSEAEVRRLISRIKLSDIAPPNLNLLENLDKIHTIISENRKINFEYGKFDVHKQMNYYNKHRSLIPCQVIYFSEHFYLKCINEADNRVRTYRIDRMKNIKSGERLAKREMLPEPKGAVVDIFEPDFFENVKLKVKRFLLDDMLEQLGKHAMYRDIPDDRENVIINVNVGISTGFYRWVMKYGANMEILAPKHVKENFLEELNRVVEIYNA